MSRCQLALWRVFQIAPGGQSGFQHGMAVVAVQEWYGQRVALAVGEEVSGVGIGVRRIGGSVDRSKVIGFPTGRLALIQAHRTDTEVPTAGGRERRAGETGPREQP
jgi:hypothetical protein